MRKKYIIIVIIIFCITCSQSEQVRNNYSSLETEPIIKRIGKISVIVDPNVEMMMILSRLAGAEPLLSNYYSKINNNLAISYLSKIDDTFNGYAFEEAVLLFRNNRLNYGTAAEYGMYLNKNGTGYTMDINDKKFIISSYRLPAKKISYYADLSFLEKIQYFREKSNFDLFFNKNKLFYNESVRQLTSCLENRNFDEWIENFYGKKLSGNLCLYITYLSEGWSFGVSYANKKGRGIPYALIRAGESESNFLFLIAHEFSHTMAEGFIEKLYKKEAINTKFKELYNKNQTFYQRQGYTSGYHLFNETITQACANKYLETIFSKELMDAYNQNEIYGRKMIFVPQISEFLTIYEENRTKYKTLEDYIPELEKYILLLEY